MALTWRALVPCVGLVLVSQAMGFPPYKTTDADVADPYTLEVRLGVVQVGRVAGEIDWVSPLLRMNFGLPRNLELISEFEYRPQDDEFGEGAVGIKWAGAQEGPLSFGVETLALLPVRPQDSGVGVESQLLATWARPDQGVQIHVNAGGFHDPRGGETVNGWRASLLAEATADDSFRPGIEVFAKQSEGHEADVRIGVGGIWSFGRLQLRSGLFAGLTDESPDVAVNLWLSTRIPFR